MENEEILGKPQIWDTPQCPAPPLPTQTKPRQPGSSSQKTCKSGIKPPAPPTPTTPPNPAPNTPPRTAGPQTPPTQARMKLPQPWRSTPRQSQYSPTPKRPPRTMRGPYTHSPKRQNKPYWGVLENSYF